MEVENSRFQLSLISKFRSEIMGVAIILVLLCHCDSFSWGIFHSYVEQLVKIAACGVDIFLFVSGFGLFYSMKKDSSLVHFYRKRFLRIIPEYLLIALVGYVVWDAIQRLGAGELLIQLSTFRASFLYGTHDNGHLWYIFFIFFVYMLFPGIYIAGNCDRKINLPFFVIVSVLPIVIELFLLVFFPKVMSTFQIERMIARIPVFLLGVYCAYQSFYNNKSVSKMWIPILFILFFVLRLFKIILFDKGDSIPYSQIFVRLANQCLAAALMMLTALFVEKIANGKLKFVHVILQWFGKASLELYLIHGFLILIWHALGLRNI